MVVKYVLVSDRSDRASDTCLPLPTDLTVGFIKNSSNMVTSFGGMKNLMGVFYNTCLQADKLAF
jgi:hypothetical protein